MKYSETLSEQFYRRTCPYILKYERIKAIIDNSDKIMTEKYGCPIIEGYADIFDMIKEVINE